MSRAAIKERIIRTTYWVEILAAVAGACAVYFGTWAAIEGDHYWVLWDGAMAYLNGRIFRSQARLRREISKRH